MIPAFLADTASEAASDPAKVVVALIGTAIGAGIYVYGRLSKLPKGHEPVASRVALAPEDRDLAFTIVRAGTDLSRALHDHGEIMRASMAPAEPPPAPRRTRTRT